MVSKESPSYYRARIMAIGAALAYELSLPYSREQEMRVAYLRNGHVPDKFLHNPSPNGYQFRDEIGNLQSFSSYIKSKQNGLSDKPLTELELHTYDTYFAMHPEKVCGKPQGGTGFSFPVRTIGSKQDIIDAINKTLKGGKIEKSEPKAEPAPAKPKEKIIITELKPLESKKVELQVGALTSELVENENQGYASFGIQPSVYNVMSAFNRLVLDINTGNNTNAAYTYKAVLVDGKKAHIEKAGTPILLIEKVTEAPADPKPKKVENIEKTQSNLKNSNFNTKEYFASHGATCEKILQPQAKPIVIPGFEDFDFFIVKGRYNEDGDLLHPDLYFIYESRSGGAIVLDQDNAKTKAKAIKKAIERLKRNVGNSATKFEEAIQRTLDYCKDLQSKKETETPKKPTLSLYKYKAKAIAIKMKLQQA